MDIEIAKNIILSEVIIMTKYSYKLLLTLVLFNVGLFFIATVDGQDIEESEESEVDKGPTSTDVTSRKIITLNLRARGGVQLIKKINSVKIIGREIKNHDEFKKIWYIKFPHFYWEQTSYRKMGRSYKNLRAYDGEVAWLHETEPELKYPVALGKEKNVEYDVLSDVHGPFVDWEVKGHNFAYQGEKKVFGQPMYLLKAKLKDGPIMWYYIDKKNFLIRRVGYQEMFAGELVDADYFITKKKKVGNVVVDMEMQHVVNGKVFKNVIYDSIDINVQINPESFKIPIKDDGQWLRQKTAK